MTSETNKPYRLGVALSGGGARGFAHAGALKALEEAGIRPDVIAGVSAGSVVAVMYAAGVRPDDMVRIFSEGKFGDFARFSARGGGLFRITRFKQHVLKQLNGIERIEDLHIPTYIGVTDIDNGQAVEFHEGPIGDIMQASCSMPIIFHPVEMNGVKYVDGGVLHNLPSWILRDKCDYLIGLNCSPMKSYRPGNSLLDIAMRTYDLMSKGQQAEDIKLCDLQVEMSELSHYKVFNLKKINTVFLDGYVQMRAALKKIDVNQFKNR
ncbi:MAG: patatin-like phospholipase family protein [Bacteroidales bacterium]|nr:patatin-like phospholipase family protein [Bacteroidales bacterium]MDE6831826.1 patatin-like phospholipase family protein [Muribaculaceae bacterium]